jgi:hypothetical protein
MEEYDIDPRRLCEIAAANTPPNVRHVPCSDLSGNSNYETGKLTAPIPDSLEKLLIYLHECAHFRLHKDAQTIPAYLRSFRQRLGRWDGCRRQESSFAMTYYSNQDDKSQIGFWAPKSGTFRLTLTRYIRVASVQRFRAEAGRRDVESGLIGSLARCRL